MSNVNALPQVSSNTSTTKSSPQTCENCKDDGPSFADMLETTEDNAVLSTEQQNQQGENSATIPQTEAGALSTAVLIALAANDSLSPEQQLSAAENVAGNDNEQQTSSESDAAFLTDLLGMQSVETDPLTQTGEAATELNLAGNTTLGDADAVTGENEFAPLIETASAKNSAADQAGVQIAPPASEGAKAPAGETSGAEAPKIGAASSEGGKPNPDANSPKSDQADLKPASSGQASSTTRPGESSDSQTGSKGSNGDAQQGKEGTPSSQTQNLKPLQQAASLFQAQDNSAQTSIKTPDMVAPSLSLSPTGDLARPAGIEGLTSTSGNPATPQVPVNSLAVHIAAQARAGNQKFSIRLDPPELGRIDIRLEINRDGQSLTHLAVEKPETLEMLRQDSRALERALNNAGLDSRNGNLSFSLREDNANRQQADKSNQDDNQWSGENANEENEVGEPVIEHTLNVSSGVDISI